MITAAKATLIPSSSQIGISSMELKDIFSITSSSRDRGNFTYFTSERMIYNILLRNLTFSLKSLTPREMSSIDILKGIHAKEAQLLQKKTTNQSRIKDYRDKLLENYKQGFTKREPDYSNLDANLKQIKSLESKNLADRSLQIYKLELNKKLSITVACIIFIFFAFPVSLYSRKSGRSVGFGVGLFVSVFYWSLLFAGQTFGIRLSFSPFFSMWTPNFIILLIGIILMIKRLKR